MTKILRYLLVVFILCTFCGCSRHNQSEEECINLDKISAERLGELAGEEFSRRYE